MVIYMIRNIPRTIYDFGKYVAKQGYDQEG